MAGPMDATSALILGAVPFLAGVGILLYVWRCWSGRSRRWATRAFTNQMVYALPPGMGAILVAFAVKVVFGDPLGNLWMAVAVVVCILGLVALIFEPLVGSALVPRPPSQQPAARPAGPADRGGDQRHRAGPDPAASRRPGHSGRLRWPGWRGSHVHDPTRDIASTALPRRGRSAATSPYIGAGSPSPPPPPRTACVTSPRWWCRRRPRSSGHGSCRPGRRRRCHPQGRDVRLLYRRLVVDTCAGPLLFEVAGAKAKAAKITETLGLRS